MVAKISSRSNSSSDVCLDGDDAVSPPAELWRVRESSSACAGDGVARAGDGGGVPSLERRRGEPSVEDGVTDRARLMAACWSGSAALKDWVESSMARRAQSVRVGAGNESVWGVSAARAFLPSLSEPGVTAPATAGRVNSYCRPSPGLLGIAGALAAPAILAATSESVGARMSPWLVPGLLSRAGAPQAAMPATQTCKPPCLRIWPKSRVHASKETQTGPWTALQGF